MSTLNDRWYRFWVARLREMEAEDLADRGDYSLILGGKK
jgi:hypothetical protein